MTPTSPAARQIGRLLADLQSTDAVRRDAAVARLRVLGTQALPRLVAFIDSDAELGARALALGALEGLDDPRAIDAALRALASADGDCAASALAVLRPAVAREHGTRLLEAVSAVAVDPTRDARVRVAAVEALSDLPDHLTQPIRDQAPPPGAGDPPASDPAAAAEWIEVHGHAVTLSRLHEFLSAFREREDAEPSARQRGLWRRARGAVHRVLAERGSRLALYDAREAFGSAQAPLPPGFLDALALVGDAGCLEPLAQAWSAARDARWRAALADTARQILRREGIGARSAVVKHVRAGWPGFL